MANTKLEKLSWPLDFKPSYCANKAFTSQKRRVILIVLDAVGCGQHSPVRAYADQGAHTLRSILDGSMCDFPTLSALGLGNIIKHPKLKPTSKPLASVGIMASASAGKDTTAGHWEIAGHLKSQALPTYAEGFPQDLMEQFSVLNGCGYLGNEVASGTEIIERLGEEHLQTGKLIVYTSADSVFQIAAHEDRVPLKTLYDICERTRNELLVGEHAVGRVIARPFVGTPETGFTRSSHRHDYSVEPKAAEQGASATILESLKDAGKSVISVGKIFDIFAGKGLTESHPTASNAEGMQKLTQLTETGEGDLIFANLVDFDMVYGHRRDREGFTKALSEFDTWLSDYLEQLGEEDLLIITADHGCDPNFQGTDHTDEDVFLIVYSKSVTPQKLTTLFPYPSFMQVSTLISDWLEHAYAPTHDEIDIKSFLDSDVRLNDIAKALKETLPIHRFYLVGGAVRDLLSRRKITDIDFAFEGDYQRALETLKNTEIFRIEKTNPEFGTAQVSYRGIPFDIALLRAEGYDNKSHYPLSSSLKFNVGIQKDSSRRDFSLNALYLDVANKTLFDPQKGFLDLCQGSLRMLSSQSFKEDPTRVIRGLEFNQRFGYLFEAHTAQQAQTCINQQSCLKKLTARRSEELENLLSQIN